LLGCNLKVEWVDIKKKNIKNSLIENYVIEMKQKYNLTENQMKKLLSDIHLGFQFKLLTNKDVEYDIENCKITNIQGFEFNNKKVKFKTTIDTQMKLNISGDTSTPTMLSQWGGEDTMKK
jgi:hypothetical protein